MRNVLSVLIQKGSGGGQSNKGRAGRVMSALGRLLSYTKYRTVKLSHQYIRLSQVLLGRSPQFNLARARILQSHPTFNVFLVLSLCALAGLTQFCKFLESCLIKGVLRLWIYAS